MRPRSGAGPEPSGSSTPPGIVPPGISLLKALPLPSVIETSTGAAPEPLPTATAMKSGPEAATSETSPW
jgi:hypothetical protein